MSKGYFIGLGDKTTCGGTVLDGDDSVNMFGLLHAREGDRVSCGQDGKIYRIRGGISYIDSHGRLMAGTLDSFSDCPCNARLIPSVFTACYGSGESTLQAPRRTGPSTFTTVAKAQEVKPGQPANPIAISVNDRAATREAIIRHLYKNGCEFVERSSWGAHNVKGEMGHDWDYSMIALHHAGRSVGCGAGAGQMRAIQSAHQVKFDDIGYHYGIDCMGKVFEGRDIRFKGSSVNNYNTGVIGIVLLGNLTTAEEGNDIVAFARQALEMFNGNIDQEIPAIQIDALQTLIQALARIGVFRVTTLVAHR